MRSKTPNPSSNRPSLQRKKHSPAEKDILSQINNMKLETLKVYQVPILNEFTQKFHKNIEIPIEFHTSVFLSRTAQRCQHHNNVITLYCVHDRLPLCVTCMYQNNTHKKHKVIPLNRATKQIEDEMREYLRSADNSLSMVQKSITKSYSNVERLEKQFPTIIKKISEFYNELDALLNEKKNQHLKHVQQTWAKMRFQYTSFSKQFERIRLYMIERINEIKNRGNDDHLLLNRNIVSHLAKAQEYLSTNKCEYHETKYNQQLRKFKEVEAIINNRLIFTSPINQKIKRQQFRNQKQLVKPEKVLRKSKQILKAVEVGNRPVIFQRQSISKDRSSPKKASPQFKMQEIQNTAKLRNSPHQNRIIQSAISKHKSPSKSVSKMV